MVVLAIAGERDLVLVMIVMIVMMVFVMMIACEYGRSGESTAWMAWMVVLPQPAASVMIFCGASFQPCVCVHSEFC